MIPKHDLTLQNRKQSVKFAHYKVVTSITRNFQRSDVTVVNNRFVMIFKFRPSTNGLGMFVQIAKFRYSDMPHHAVRILYPN